MESAIPLGLIVNELVTNSLKYAFEGRQEGSVWVRFLRAGDDWVMTVADDGIGLPPTAERHEGVGSQLVRGLAAQLKARLEYVDGPEGRGLAVVVSMDAQGVR
jgi:two-component sensor histidine kinase